MYSFFFLSNLEYAKWTVARENITYTHSLTHSRTHALTHSLTHARTHARMHLLSLRRLGGQQISHHIYLNIFDGLFLAIIIIIT